MNKDVKKYLTVNTPSVVNPVTRSLVTRSIIFISLWIRHIKVPPIDHTSFSSVPYLSSTHIKPGTRVLRKRPLPGYSTLDLLPSPSVSLKILFLQGLSPYVNVPSVLDPYTLGVVPVTPPSSHSLVYQYPL